MEFCSAMKIRRGYSGRSAWVYSSGGSLSQSSVCDSTSREMSPRSLMRLLCLGSVALQALIFPARVSCREACKEGLHFAARCVGKWLWLLGSRMQPLLGGRSASRRTVSLSWMDAAMIPGIWRGFLRLSRRDSFSILDTGSDMIRPRVLATR